MPATKKTAKKSVAKTAAKKTTKAPKKAAKRPAAKKVAKKTTKKAPLKKAVSGTQHSKASCACKKVDTPAQAFWVHNGPVVHSVCELKVVLGEITDEQFEYHTKRAGNDFACWLRDCLGDAATAARLEKARGRSGAVSVLVCSC